MTSSNGVNPLKVPFEAWKLARAGFSGASAAAAHQPSIIKREGCKATTARTIDEAPSARPFRDKVPLLILVGKNRRVDASARANRVSKRSGARGVGGEAARRRGGEEVRR
jgi:hypothetical protein